LSEIILEVALVPELLPHAHLDVLALARLLALFEISVVTIAFPEVERAFARGNSLLEHSDERVSVLLLALVQNLHLGSSLKEAVLVPLPLEKHILAPHFENDFLFLRQRPD